MAETVIEIRGKRLGVRGKAAKPIKLSEIKKTSLKRLKTGLSEVDRVLGRGLVPGSVILLAGDPGIGKSTLLTQIMAKSGGLYVAGEESAEQIKIRTERLQLKTDKFLVLPETNVEAIISTIQQFNNSNNLNIVVVDSIQSMTTEDLTGTAGSIGQVRESANKFLQSAKRTKIPVFLVGHITKSGVIAGPKVLEHLVDVVLYLEGDKKYNFRILRAYKNRFGSIDEVGIFEMTQKGLIQITDPSNLFLKQKVKKAPGSVVVSVLQGLRPMLVEIQALAVPTNLVVPRRLASGIAVQRVHLLCAVLQKTSRLPLNKYDIYLNVAGGLRIDEPAVDLGICVAIASSLKNQTISQDTVFIGEVGLLGEIRDVNQLEKRVREARKLGFKQTITPEKYHSINDVIHRFLKTS